MTTQTNSFLQRHAVAAYFALAFVLSWAGAFAVAAPSLVHGRTPDKMAGLFMFPAMILGPSLSCLTLTAIIEGGAGLRDLRRRLLRWPSPAFWLFALLIPPILIVSVLCIMQRAVSPIYAPNHFWIGILFGIPAGLFEEIGWTGFAFPRMEESSNAFAGSVVLGLVWVCWHLPVVNYLGTATPHGVFWPLYFAVFGLAMLAMRVLIGWLYVNTRSLMLAQLMHISSTGSLVVFSAMRVNALQECAWYAVYATALWCLVLLVRMRFGRSLAASVQRAEVVENGVGS